MYVFRNALMNSILDSQGCFLECKKYYIIVTLFNKQIVWYKLSCQTAFISQMPTGCHGSGECLMVRAFYTSTVRYTAWPSGGSCMETLVKEMALRDYLEWINLYLCYFSLPSAVCRYENHRVWGNVNWIANSSQGLLMSTGQFSSPLFSNMKAILYSSTEWRSASSITQKQSSWFL